MGLMAGHSLGRAFAYGGRWSVGGIPTSKSQRRPVLRHGVHEGWISSHFLCRILLDVLSRVDGDEIDDERCEGGGDEAWNQELDVLAGETTGLHFLDAAGTRSAFPLSVKVESHDACGLCSLPPSSVGQVSLFPYAMPIDLLKLTLEGEGARERQTSWSQAVSAEEISLRSTLLVVA